MKTENTTFGISLPALLSIAFIVLKLCGVIAWSWWWVLAPLWGAIALAIIATFIVVIVKSIHYK